VKRTLKRGSKVLQIVRREPNQYISNIFFSFTGKKNNGITKDSIFFFYRDYSKIKRRIYYIFLEKEGEIFIFLLKNRVFFLN